MTVLVTGASGFVGRAVLDRLKRDGKAVRASTRRAGAISSVGVEEIVVGDLDERTDWRTALRGVDAIIHLAARVHVMRDSAADSLAEFRRVNTAGTLRLAAEAAAAGVHRFVYLSSIKVNGESGVHSETTPALPSDPYGMSKHEAELGLAAIAAKSTMAVTVVRPPLVYGPGVKANFRALMRIVATGIPLPFGAVQNRRSLLAVDNLADFIVTSLAHSAAANQTFLVSDGEDLSTPELIRRIARASGRRARLVPVPESLLVAGARVLGRGDLAQRLLGSLQLDISKATTVLGWNPPVSVDEGIRRAVAGAR